MKFYTILKENKDGWHRWFAWYPVRLENQVKSVAKKYGNELYNVWVWLEWVERKIELAHHPDFPDYYSYR